jgi:hypothetical protein
MGDCYNARAGGVSAGAAAGIKEQESEIKAFSEGVSIRYTGDAEVTHVSARYFQGNATVGDPPDNDDSTNDATES